MTKRKDLPATEIPAWRAGADAVRLETLKDALTSAQGCIGDAAELVKVSRQHATNLVRRFELTEYAAQLRLRAGRGRRGRPRSK